MEAVLPVEIEMGSLRVALEQQIPEGIDQRSSGKFRPNWSGPYFIRELTLKGIAWLMDLDGNRFSEPTNVDELKRAMAHEIFCTCCISYMRAWVLIIGKRFFDVWVRFSCGFGLPGLRICHLIFSIYYTFDVILGHIPFQLRFVDFHGVVCSSPLMRITHLMIDDLVLLDFLIYHIFDAILGYRSSRSCMIIPTYGMLTETMAGSLPCHDPSMEPLWSHPTRPHFSAFGCRHAYYSGRHFIDVWIFMELHDLPHSRDAYQGDDVFVIFTRISHWSLSEAIQLGPYFSALRCHHASPSERYLLDLWVDDSISFCPDAPGEPFLRRLVRLILYDIVVILGQSYLRHMDSHITILVEYMSDLLRIPIELFASHQDKPGTSDAILGHISLLQLWR
ncbi:hypothetical protein CK203_052953 [Vitis vinifera]|uniref:Uncharacterized protein n=1 Tax=Vitis vinifera TaxID=29760 RepID=A0A438GT33_VITVI|nr:hypothetical protein CK203_052953 [Vitis vinifera]